MREELDVRIAALPPSLFDLQDADDLEVDDEIFGEGLMQYASEVENGNYY